MFENKALVRRFVEEVQGQHNLDLAEELMSPTMIDHYLEAQGLPHSTNAVGDFKRFYLSLLAAFPDLTATIHHQVAEGDLVATYKTLYGTHRGEFMGIKPTERKIALHLMDIFRVAEGRLVEHWAVIDLMGLRWQIEAKPLKSMELSKP